MKRWNWMRILLILGALLVLASIVLYLGQVTSCYPPASVWQRFTTDEMNAFNSTCRLSASPLSRFADFLTLFIPGILLFTVPLLRSAPRSKGQRRGAYRFFLILMIGEALFLTLAGLLQYPVPGVTPILPIWIVGVISGLGFAGYIGLLGVWFGQRWGSVVYEGTATALAALFLLSRGALLLASILILSVILMAVFQRPVRAGKK